MTTTATSSPTSTGWTTAEAGEQYHQIAEGVRAETRAFNRAYMADEVDMDALRKACTDLGKASDDAMRLLNVGQWPADVQPAIDKVIENYAAQVASMQSCKAAKSLQAMVSAAGEPVPNEGAGQVARVKLGLPPAVQDG